MKNHTYARGCARLLAVTLLVGALAIPSPITAVPRLVVGPQRWTQVEGLNLARAAHTATLLDDGRVLIVGGWNETRQPFTDCEIYDPSTQRWTVTGNLRIARVNHTATRLLDGRVLVAAGFQSDGTAEIYDPATGTWSDTDSIGGNRQGHTATLLEDGRVLVAGGTNRATSQVFDPQTGTWSEPVRMPYIANFHAATRLPDGRVLVVGGSTGNSLATATKQACIYDPAAGTWTRTGRLRKPRSGHSSVLLPNGMVLVSGGANRARKPYTSCELFDPATGAWQSTGAQSTPGGIMVSLADGSVLALGSPAKIYMPETGLWVDSDAFPFGTNPEAPTRLADGSVLVEGGYRDSAPFPATAIAAFYTP